MTPSTRRCGSAFLPPFARSGPGGRSAGRAWRTWRRLPGSRIPRMTLLAPPVLPTTLLTLTTTRPPPPTTRLMAPPTTTPPMPPPTTRPPPRTTRLTPCTAWQPPRTTCRRDPAGWSHDRDPRAASPWRERMEQVQPVHRLGRCRPVREGRARGAPRRRAADRARPAARHTAHVRATARHPHRPDRAGRGRPAVDPGAALLAAERTALRRPAGQEQEADAGRVW